MPDYLSCGSCPVDFELADIVSFIEHKRQRCVDGTVDSDQLECIKCAKKFHTPWPLLIHIQVDHEILIVRNLSQLSLPLAFKTSLVTPLAQCEQSVAMDTDQEANPSSQNHKDVFTQTQKSRSSSSCCQPRLLPPCCQKVEPQCYDEPCLCPSVSEVICTSNTCYINRDPQNLENDESSCCACPQGPLKKESREVQTDLEYNDDLDINFLLSNTSTNNRDFEDHTEGTFHSQSTTFSTSQFVTDFPESMDKPWGYYTPAITNGTSNTAHSNGNYMDSFDRHNYHMLMPNLRLPNHTNPNYVPSNNHLLVSVPRSLTSSPNLVPSIDNFPPPSSDQGLSNQTTLFQESNNSFHFRGINGQDPINVVPPHSSPSHKDATPLFPRNENCALTYIPSGSDLSADFNTENFENEKVDSERKEFRFLCPNCGKRFRQKVHLRKHVMSQHARQKPHKCSQCGYTTVEKSHLTVHIRTHTGERPYTCRRCSYSSAQNCTLKSHYLRRHPGDQIDCLLCGSFFITEQERNNHQRSCRIVNGGPQNGVIPGQSHNGGSGDHVDSSKTG